MPRKVARAYPGDGPYGHDEVCEYQRVTYSFNDHFLVKNENVGRYIVLRVITFVSSFCARTRRTQYPNWPTYSRRMYIAMSHGFGEIDEGYCFSTPPVGTDEYPP